VLLMVSCAASARVLGGLAKPEKYTETTQKDQKASEAEKNHREICKFRSWWYIDGSCFGEAAKSCRGLTTIFFLTA
jgi:hypothetical protein